MTKLIPKNILAASGEISIGMIRYEKITGGGGDPVETSEVEESTSTATVAKDLQGLSTDFGTASVHTVGSTSQANLVAAPYGLNEFYGYQYKA